MIVRCEECSTRFNLDESRLRGDSAKVRCSKCRHEFIVYKGKETASAEGLNTVNETPSPDTDITTESSDISFDGGFDFSSPLDEQTAAVKQDDSFDLFGSDEPVSSTVSDFSLPQSEDEKSIPEEAKPVELPSDTDIFSFADVAPVDEPPKAKAKEISDIKDKAATPSGSLEFSFDADEQQPASPPETIEFGEIEFGIPDAPEEKFIPTVNEEPPQPAEPAAHEFIPQQIIEEAAPSFFSEYKPFIAAGVGTILLTAVLTAGYFGIKGKPGDPARLGIQNISTPGEEEKGSFTIEKPAAKFVKNSVDGELFVVKAMAVNNYESPRVGVEAQLTFFSIDGKSIGTSNAFCNSDLQNEDLESTPFIEIQKILNQGPSDDPLENTPVESGGKVECVIVVKDMPKDAVDYGVQIVHSSGEKLDDL